MSDYATMKEIGSEFGLTSHQIGKILKEIKLRTSEGKPSAQAFELALVKQKCDGLGHYLWAWNTSKLRIVLERLGYQPKQ